MLTNFCCKGNHVLLTYYNCLFSSYGNTPRRYKRIRIVSVGNPRKAVDRPQRAMGCLCLRRHGITVFQKKCIFVKDAPQLKYDTYE